MSKKKVLKIILLILSALLAATQTINENGDTIKFDDDRE